MSSYSAEPQDQKLDDSFASPTFDECEHLHMLARIHATRNRPAFGVDLGELNYRVLGRLIRAGLVSKARAYRWGERRTRTGYWLSAAGWRFVVGDAKPSSMATIDDANDINPKQVVRQMLQASVQADYERQTQADLESSLHQQKIEELP